MVSLSIKNIDPQFHDGLNALAADQLIQIAEDGIIVSSTQASDGLRVVCDAGGAHIRYHKKVEFFRGISYLIQGVREPIDEVSAFEDNGYMLDCSRNAVASVSAVKKLVRHMALMGLSTLQLYTEDTFEIPEWTYFGYQRGRYTGAEIKEMDAYARQFGIELIPCVQTLAHLNQALRWRQFGGMIDCNDILLAGDDETYRFIDDMMRQLSSQFSTRRVHIGMDEAHMLGLGRYLSKNGYQNRNEIICNHLTKVVDICKKYGLKPMMWSDMFFRLAFNGNYYVQGDQPLPPETLALLNPDVELVYWDYYHKEQDHYINQIRQHQKMPNTLVFAGGAWKWHGLLPDLKYSEVTTRSALNACRERDIKDVFATGWGDDGAECAAFSILPILQLYAEMGYQGDIDRDVLSARFTACTGGILEDFYLMDEPNETTPTFKDTMNPTKYLLYQDVMIGLFDMHVDAQTFPKHFRECALKLEKVIKRGGRWSYMFQHVHAMCLLLEKKCTLGLEITERYLNADKQGLQDLVHGALQETIALAKQYLITAETQWLEENKAFGLEVIHIRIGGVLTRLEAAARRIQSYVDGHIDSLEELETERLQFNGPYQPDADVNIFENRYQNIVSASRLSW